MMETHTFVTIITGSLAQMDPRAVDPAADGRRGACRAQPVFSLTGPDAVVYGAADGYPPDTPGPAMNSQPFIVGSYSQYDEILKVRVVPRSAQASGFSPAPQEMALAYAHQGSIRVDPASKLVLVHTAARLRPPATRSRAS